MALTRRRSCRPEDIQVILDDTAGQWDALTERIGVDKQRRAYQDWASKPNACAADQGFAFSTPGGCRAAFAGKIDL